MGVSPAEPLQVALIIGGIAFVCLVLSFAFYFRHWMKNNPGVVKNLVVHLKNQFFDSVDRIIQRLKKSGLLHVKRVV